MGLPRDRLSSWLAAPRGSGEAGGGETPSAKEADFIVLPAEASDAWRTWLMTGTRRPPFDRRRINGAHRGLKKLMIEGTTSPPDRSLPWNDFSAAMIRQAVDEALNALPSSQKQAVKLAYFGGLANKEIAEHLGVHEDAVKRMLQVAMATVSAHVEHGKTTTRKVIYFLAIWVGGRRLIDFLRHLPPAVDQVAQASVIVAAGVVTASVLVSHSPSPAHLTQADRGRLGVTPPAAGPAIPLPKSPIGPITGTAPITLPSAPPAPSPSLPVKVSVPPVTIPTPPAALPTPPPLPTPP
ncbi:MAG TPA: sigma factor-like helix-turn-helix DNA-binding protein [Candidatus Dormibacteraeota bacterium]